MDFFFILAYAITVSSITVDCKHRDFVEVVETVAETEEVLHLHFLFELDKRIVKLR